MYDTLSQRPNFKVGSNDEAFTFDLEVARTVKEAYCHVPLDYDTTMKQLGEGIIASKRVYKLPGTHQEVILNTEDLI